MLLNIQNSAAQFVEDFRAKAVLEKQYTDVKGSPYLQEDWAEGLVKLANGNTYANVPLKYDQVTGELIFRDKAGKVLTFADPVREFKLSGQLFRSGYKVVDSNSDHTFYLVLYDGTSTLLKDARKNIIQHRAYNSATTVKSIVETPVWYLLINGQPVKVRKDKKSVLAALKTNTAELEKYISENNLNLKDDQDLARLIAYYDSIKL